MLTRHLIVNPPPCQKHYLLGNCPFKSGCKFGHEYLLGTDDMRDLADSAKGIPCKEITKGSRSSHNLGCTHQLIVASLRSQMCNERTLHIRS